ncbi:MAG: hypothetical protein ABIK31_07805 [candidate division WOR-3 bacterium]
MENIILKILDNDISLIQVFALLLVLLVFLIKQRKTNEKIDLISENHLHTINETLQRIEGKIEGGFQNLDDKLTDIQKSVEIIKDRQKRK